jgi:hypothetical protein
MNEETFVYALYLARSLDRQAELEILVKRLWLRIEEQQILLNSAVHELGAEKRNGNESIQAFTIRWYREHRAGGDA